MNVQKSILHHSEREREDMTMKYMMTCQEENEHSQLFTLISNKGTKNSTKTLAGCRFKSGTSSNNKQLDCELHAKIITDSIILVFKKLLILKYSISIHSGI